MIKILWTQLEGWWWNEKTLETWKNDWNDFLKKPCHLSRDPVASSGPSTPATLLDVRRRRPATPGDASCCLGSSVSRPYIDKEQLVSYYRLNKIAIFFFIDLFVFFFFFFVTSECHRRSCLGSTFWIWRLFSIDLFVFLFVCDVRDAVYGDLFEFGAFFFWISWFIWIWRLFFCCFCDSVDWVTSEMLFRVNCLNLTPFSAVSLIRFVGWRQRCCLGWSIWIWRFFFNFLIYLNLAPFFVIRLIGWRQRCCLGWFFLIWRLFFVIRLIGWRQRCCLECFIWIWRLFSAASVILLIGWRQRCCLGWFIWIWRLFSAASVIGLIGWRKRCCLGLIFWIWRLFLFEFLGAGLWLVVSFPWKLNFKTFEKLKTELKLSCLVNWLK